MFQCYNRGCGLMFDPETNTEESCRHHPGFPFFHDAYKGWTCCNRKSVDFTEFLNMKGCALGKHSNLKPPEPDKQTTAPDVEIIAQKPIFVKINRPSFEAPLTKINTSVMPALKSAVDALPSITEFIDNSDKLEIGVACKNGGCKCAYSSPDSDETECQYHPGVPIFHEGMKYWSCCQKKTSDFQTFMDQKGCCYGKHKWKDDHDKKTVPCRYDWHQTATEVIVTIYAKLYHYEKSLVEMNPIRLKVSLIFPKQNNAVFALDLELRGIVDVDRASATMFPTKLEINMPKAEVGSWSNLYYSRPAPTKNTENLNPTKPALNETSESESDIDLDDIEYMR